jgi:hypothetical protein
MHITACVVAKSRPLRPRTGLESGYRLVGDGNMTKSCGAEYCCGKPRSALAYVHDFRTAIIVGQPASPLVSAIKDRKGMTRLGKKKARAQIACTRARNGRPASVASLTSCPTSSATRSR